MFKTLKRRIYTYTMGYKDYQEEIQENSVVLQIKYSKYLFWFFFLYTLLIVITDA